MQLLFLRHATLLIEWNNKKILIDPMLGAKSSMDPVANAANTIRNPMLDLPLDETALQQLLQSLDAVIVTHTHRDHWDPAATQLLPKQLPIFCQWQDEEKIKAAGFTQVIPVATSHTWEGLTLHRTDGQHGTGEIGQKMAPVSGFVLQGDGASLYIAGDTIWCEEVDAALSQYQPAYTIVNAGAAQFISGDPITMTAEDVLAVITHSANTKVIAVHMETINHCYLTREALSAAVAAASQACIIPAPGERIQLN
ncbi:MBL fold metallo-hydrolase [Chitinophaga vietnamensis]|uniref:MBL fold metallo-hydrolase n=1 Tax=Chitinophaga vietnamensis TaxID=2593957 RepID=UPI0011788042|nr:MBL fold metallo-hydrolase [Chitinophaga vietnamensis]